MYDGDKSDDDFVLGRYGVGGWGSVWLLQGAGGQGGGHQEPGQLWTQELL